MSRFEIEDDSLEIVVRWDPLASTYFVQVRTRPEDSLQNPDDLFWRGLKSGDLRFEHEVVGLVAPYVTLADEQRKALRLSMERNEASQGAIRKS